MYGWINDCVKKLVITKFGQEAWNSICLKAGILNTLEWIRHQYYPDSDTYDLVGAASATLGVEADTVLEVFGQYFMDFVRGHGYENMLRCQGSSLREWLGNINDLHKHLQSNLPELVAPEVMK
jgi:guanylate cyclase soluble subunit beta